MERDGRRSDDVGQAVDVCDAADAESERADHGVLVPRRQPRDGEHAECRACRRAGRSRDQRADRGRGRKVNQLLIFAKTNPIKAMTAMTMITPTAMPA